MGSIISTTNKEAALAILDILTRAKCGEVKTYTHQQIQRAKDELATMPDQYYWPNIELMARQTHLRSIVNSTLKNS